MDFLPRLHKGRVLRVVEPHLLEVDIDVGFGVRVTRYVHLEGLSDRFAPKHSRASAMHTLVIICGGKDILIYADSGKIESPTIGRVYLDSNKGLDGVWMVYPPEGARKLLEVSTLMQHVKDSGFDVSEAKRILNAKKGK